MPKKPFDLEEAISSTREKRESEWAASLEKERVKLEDRLLSILEKDLCDALGIRVYTMKQRTPWAEFTYKGYHHFIQQFQGEIDEVWMLGLYHKDELQSTYPLERRRSSDFKEDLLYYLGTLQDTKEKTPHEAWNEEYA